MLFLAEVSKTLLLAGIFEHFCLKKLASTWVRPRPECLNPSPVYGRGAGERVAAAQ
jgi:hypothetical protein